jgi:A/G-specific adenine glycosylase
MLQQTRVETVIPYFERFLKLFPTIQSLARSPLSRVLQAWAGLGYYARARHLHEAARAICRQHDGKIPTQKGDLLNLPGFGPYTAGAVASIAFGNATAALDGNVARLLGRLFRLKVGPVLSRQKKQMERLAECLIPSGRAADFNQSLMDLGAMVCLPVRPRCPACPVRRFCAGKENALIPKKGPRKEPRQEEWTVAVVEREGRYFLYLNEKPGLLSGLWQFPTRMIRSPERPVRKTGTDRYDRRALKQMLREEFAMEVRVQAALPQQKHLFTHIAATLKPYCCSFVRIRNDLPPSRKVRWIKPGSFSRYPISTAMRKITALISPAQVKRRK